jgi:Two component regulator propeller
MHLKQLGISIILMFICSQILVAQQRPIGYWRSHLPYNSVKDMASDGKNIFVINNQAFFVLDEFGAYHTYSKVEGMSDIGMNCGAYDTLTNTLILAYSNSNIDLFDYKTETFFNLPDLKLKAISGSKNINSIYCENGTAFICTDIGLLVIDLVHKVFKETIVFNVNNQSAATFQFLGFGNNYYVITSAGLYSIAKNNPVLQNIAEWTLVDKIHGFQNLCISNNNLFLASADSLFVFKNAKPSFIYTANYVDQGIDPGNQNTTAAKYKHVIRLIEGLYIDNSGLWIAQYDTTNYTGMEYKLDNQFRISDSLFFSGVLPVKNLMQYDGSFWVGNKYGGLMKRINGNNFNYFIPPGPGQQDNYDIYAYNGEVLVAHGGYTDMGFPNNNIYGYSHFAAEAWTDYIMYHYPCFGDSLEDFTAILKDQTDGTIYGGTFVNGLFAAKADNSCYNLKQNSVVEGSINNPGWYQIMGLCQDNNNNLFATVYGATHQLISKPAGSNQWIQLKAMPLLANFNIHNDAGMCITDDFNHIWFASPNGSGVIVYDNNNTPADISDDTYRQLNSTNINLPNDATISLAKDKNGDIWVGTFAVDNKGSLTQISNNANINNITTATTPIEQYDSFANYLFQGENIRTLAIDGANRKWVGSDNGVWLLSGDETKQVYRFTKDNSPLPSNNIQKITIDPVTGDIYVGTDNGLVSFRSTATQGNETNSNVLCFPNPVNSNYNGTIAIKGLVADADVRITDITGQLVYKTTALGGQAVWSGKDYTGHRPQSGVYLVFISNKDGSETFVSKLVFMN